MKKVSLLIESQLEMAELSLAVRDIADTLQGFSEKLSDALVQDVPAIVERIKAEKGIEVGEQFSATITQLLQSNLQSLQAAKSSIDNQALMLTGDAPATFGQPATPETDLTQAAPEDSGQEAAGEASGPAEAPEGRAMKPLPESIKVAFEQHNGKVVTKTFKNVALAESFITQNETKIKSLKVL